MRPLRAVVLTAAAGSIDLRLLDVLGERELLLDVGLKVEQLATPGLGVVERAQDNELVDRAEARLVDGLLAPP